MKKKTTIVVLMAAMSMMSLVGCGKKVIAPTEAPTTEITTEVSTTETTTEVTTEATTEATTETVTVSKGSDVCGAINGIGIDVVKGTLFGPTFGVAGFEFDLDAAQFEQYILPMKYPDDDSVQLLLYGKDKNKGYTSEMIESEGFYGYEISVASAKNKPVMTFNGLTWGASMDDIKSVYGEPTDYEYEDGDIVRYLTYETDSYRLKFQVYDKTSHYDGGLQAVLVQNLTTDREIHYKDDTSTTEVTTESTKSSKTK